MAANSEVSPSVPAFGSAISRRDNESDAMLCHAWRQTPDLWQKFQSGNLAEGFSTAHFFLKKRAPSNAPPTATAAGIPKPNSGAGPLQAAQPTCAHAGIAVMTKQTAPRIIRISDSPSRHSCRHLACIQSIHKSKHLASANWPIDQVPLCICATELILLQFRAAQAARSPWCKATL